MENIKELKEENDNLRAEITTNINKLISNEIEQESLSNQ